MTSFRIGTGNASHGEEVMKLNFPGDMNNKGLFPLPPRSQTCLPVLFFWPLSAVAGTHSGMFHLLSEGKHVPKRRSCRFCYLLKLAACLPSTQITTTLFASSSRSLKSATYSKANSLIYVPLRLFMFKQEQRASEVLLNSSSTWQTQTKKMPIKPKFQAYECMRYVDNITVFSLRQRSSVLSTFYKNERREWLDRWRDMIREPLFSPNIQWLWHNTRLWKSFFPWIGIRTRVIHRMWLHAIFDSALSRELSWWRLSILSP